MMKTGTRWAIPVVSYNHIYQTWSINGCLRYNGESMPFMQKLAKILRFYDLNTPFRLIVNQCSYLAS